MCGFSGLYVAGDREVAPSEIDRVKSGRQILAHRGPDESGFFECKSFAVGFNRLSIVSLEDGAQPFVSRDGRYTIVFNGEIYNYKELAGCCQGIEPRSEVEVIAGLYERIGSRAFALLRGMFAILIYDSQDNEVVAARDLFGIKPLYYTRYSDTYLFASEIAALPLPDRAKIVSREAVSHYCSFGYVPEPHTIYREVYALPGGHYARFSSSGVQLSEFSRKEFLPPLPARCGSMKSRLRDTLEKCVERYMGADVEVGTFLSGGVDSTIVAALASRVNPAVKAFTIGFANKDYPSETELAVRSAEYLGLDLIYKIFDHTDFVEAFEPTVRHLGSPLADPSAIGVYLLSKTASEHVKTALSGEGADELFGGYKGYRTTAWTARFGKAQSTVDSTLRLFSKMLGKDNMLRRTVRERCFRLDKNFIGPTFIMGDKAKRELLASRAYSAADHRDMTSSYLHASGLSRLQKMQLCDWNLWLPCDILYKGDRLSMANSLEVRVPFLDKKVYDVARQLRADEKVSVAQSKILLRDAFADLLPPDVVTRPKLGFPVPVASWLKNELYDWGRSRLSCDAAGDIIDTRRALDLFEKYRKGAAPEFSFRTIWLLIVLTAWYAAPPSRTIS